MNFKFENGKRSSDMRPPILNAPLKSMVKDKARKQLWESLLEVYESEASVGADPDCEEVEVSQLEVWSVSRSENTFRALPHVARTNPQLLTDALPGAKELHIENQENFPQRKGTTRSTALKIKKRKNSSTFKIYKNSTPISIDKKRIISKRKSNIKELLVQTTNTEPQEQKNKEIRNVNSKNHKMKKAKSRGLKASLKGLELTRSLMQHLDKELRANNGCISLERLVDKQFRKKQRKYLKKVARYQAYEDNIEKPLIEQVKEKRKIRKTERPKMGLRRSKKIKESRDSKIKQVQPLIVLHERVEKHLTNSSDGVFTEQKHLSNIQAERDKQDESNSKCTFQGSIQNNNCYYGQTQLQYRREILEHNDSIINNKKPAKDKERRRRKRFMTYNTSEKDVSSQMKRTQKHSKQQMIKEIAKSLGISEDMLNKIKNLPFTVDESQFIFMDPSHIDKILESCNDLSKMDESQGKHKSSKDLKFDFGENSGIKLNSDQISSKYSKYLTSRNHLKNSKKCKDNNNIQLTNGISDNVHNPSSINIKDYNEKRRKKRYSMVGKKNTRKNNKGVNKNMKNEQKTRNNEEDPEMFTREIYPKIEDTVINKLSTIFSEPPITQAEGAFGDYNLNTCSQIKTENMKKHRRKSFEKDHNCKVRTKLNLARRSDCEDRKKLTLKLVKRDSASEKCTRDNKRNIYSLNGNKELKPSERSFIASSNKDRLMLFYANRESSTTSKESLNIAISRDTEISDNGSSNILNVVIKQTMNSVSNTTTSYFTTMDEKNDKNIMCHKDSYKHKGFNSSEVLEVNKEDSMCREKSLKDACCQTDSRFSLKEGNNQIKLTRESPNIGYEESVRNETNNIENNSITFNSNGLPDFNGRIVQEDGTNIINRIQDFSSLNEPIKSDLTELILKTSLKNKCEKEFNSSDKTEGCTYLNATNEKSGFFRVLNNDEYLVTNKKQKHKPELSYESCDEIEVVNNSTKLDLIQDKSVTIKSQTRELNLNKIESLKNKAFIKIIESENSLQQSLSAERINLTPATENIFISTNEVSNSSKNHNVKIKINNNFQLPSSEKNDIILQNTANYINVNNTSKRIATENYNNRLQFNFFPKKEIKITKEMPNSLKESFFNERPVKINRKCSPVYHAEDIQKKRENFVSVIPTNTETADVSERLTKVVSNDMLNHQNNKDHIFKFGTNHKSKYFPNIKLGRTFAVSEVGVQTETSQFLTSKNEIFCCNRDLQRNEGVKLCAMKQFNPPIPLHAQTKIKRNKPMFDNNNFVSIEDNLETKVPEKKGAFVHIVTNNALNTDLISNEYNKNSEKENGMFSFVSQKYTEDLQSSENIEFLRISKNEKHEKEQQILYKINAIYEFLQYLDKILRNNVFTRTGGNCKADLNIGMFNSTLRCLCSNCMDILNKLEASKVQIQDNNKQIPINVQSLEKKTLLQNDNKKSKFVNIINEQNKKGCQDKENEYKEEHFLNLSEIETTIYHDPQHRHKQNQMFSISNPKPFFVVVPSNESLHNSLTYKKIDSNFEKGCGDQIEQQFFNLEDQIGSLLMTRKINNYILHGCKCNKSSCMICSNNIKNMANKKSPLSFNDLNKRQDPKPSNKRKDCSGIKKRLGNKRLQPENFTVNCHRRSVENVNGILSFNNEHGKSNLKRLRSYCTIENLKISDCYKKSFYDEDFKDKLINRKSNMEESKINTLCNFCIHNQPINREVKTNELQFTDNLKNSVESSLAIFLSEERSEYNQGKRNTGFTEVNDNQSRGCKCKHNLQTGEFYGDSDKGNNLNRCKDIQKYYNHSKGVSELKNKVNKNSNSLINLQNYSDLADNIKTKKTMFSCCIPKCVHSYHNNSVTTFNSDGNISKMNENYKTMKCNKEVRQQQIPRTHLTLSSSTKNKKANPIKNYINLEGERSITQKKSQHINHINFTGTNNKLGSHNNSREDLRIKTSFAIKSFDSESSIGTDFQSSSMIFLNNNMDFADKYIISDSFGNRENKDKRQVNYCKKQDSLTTKSTARCTNYDDGWISISNPNLLTSLNDESVWQNELEKSSNEEEFKISDSAKGHAINTSENYSSLVTNIKT